MRTTRFRHFHFMGFLCLWVVGNLYSASSYARNKPKTCPKTLATSAKLPRQQGWELAGILDGIIALHEAGYCVWAPFMDDESEPGMDILEGAIGRWVTIRTLHANAKRIAGTWYKALEKASRRARRQGKPEVARQLTPTAVRKRGMELKYPTNVVATTEEGIQFEQDSTPLDKWVQLKGGKKQWERTKKWKAPEAFEKRRPHHWSEERMRAVFEILTWEEIPLNRSTIGSNHPVILEAIFFVTGRYRPSYTLVNAIIARWGSNWATGLAHLGFEPDRAVHIWTHKRIIRGILALRVANRPLNAGKISKDRTVRGSRILKRELGLDVNPASLYQAAKNERYFGSWDEALRAAYLDPEAIRLRSANAVWTREKVATAIFWLAYYGVPINSNSLTNDSSERTRRILSYVIGWPSTGKSLEREARKYFGSLWNAMEAAGLDPDEHYYYRKYSIPKLIEVINLLYKKKVPLNSWAIQRDFSDETKALIKSVLGWTANGKCIHDAAIRRFGKGGWDKLLIRAGKDPRKIRKRTWARSGLTMVTLQTLSDRDVPATVRWETSESGLTDATGTNSAAFCQTLIEIIEELPEDERELAYSVVDTIVDRHTASDVAALVCVLSLERDEGYSPLAVENTLKFLTTHEKLRRFRWSSKPKKDGTRTFDHGN